MNLTDMLSQHVDEGGGWFCSCQPIDDETGEREHLPGTWEQHLADQIREWLLNDEVFNRADEAVMDTTNRQCGLCGRDPALGLASITSPDGTEVRYCHGNTNGTTCYQQAVGASIRRIYGTWPCAPYPHVQGNCPACGNRSLFLGEGGYVTCSNHACTRPDHATDVLEGDQ